jgi:hypothetical protein
VRERKKIKQTSKKKKKKKKKIKQKCCINNLIFCRPNYLKIVIEGYEFESLVPLFDKLHRHFDATKEDLFPTQIGIEVHYQSSNFHLDEEALLGFANYAFHIGGYTVAHRRDNWMGYHACELLLVRVNCQTPQP